MLSNVPEAINRMARNVIINHPNTCSCVCIRKVVNRVGAELVGGLPTLGGMAVMESYDEENISWTPLGNGYAMRTEAFEPSIMMNAEDANNGTNDETRFLVVAENDGEFTLEMEDAFYLIMGPVRLAYEIVLVETTSNIPPYTQRYVCNRRNDLDHTI